MYEDPNAFDPALRDETVPQRRAFAWDELSARLAAMRDARAVLARVQRPSGGSFRRAVGIGTDHRAQGEGAVNLNGLGDGKANGSGWATAAQDAPGVDREAE